MWTCRVLEEHIVCAALNVKITYANGLSIVIRIQVNDERV